MSFREFEPRREIKQETKERPPIADEIKSWLEKTPLSEEARGELLKKSLEFYEKIKDLRYSKEEKAKAALFLSCDDYLCAIPRKIPPPKLKVLTEARKETGVKPVEAIQRIDSMCKLIKRSEKVAEKAKEILSKYKEEYPADYAKGPPLTTALAALYISGILSGEHITQMELWEFFGITGPTLRNKWKDIAEKLDIDISLYL